MKLLIKNAHVINPANKIDAIQDILVQGSRIIKVSRDIRQGVDKVIDANGKIAMPGVIDMHVHLREPGREDKETVSSATLAALKGGVTTVLAMPNTELAIDCLENVKLLQEIIKRTAKANVLIIAAITKGRLGKELTDIVKLKKQGVVAISDDGASVDSPQLLLQALKKAKQKKILVICHCEDKAISGRGVINRGIISTRMGLRGIPKEAEYKRIQRDIGLAKEANSPIHIAHVSCRESVDLISQAKAKGIKVTVETAPQYLSLTEEAVLGYDTNMKMNPPLRSKEDVQAIRKGLKRGVIDVIASDHAPHTENEKEIEFERAEFGVVGLETELAVSITELIHGKILNWTGLVEKLCLNPARILGIDKGTLDEGKDADIIIVDPQKTWTVKKDDFLSKSRNSCFLNQRLKGKAEYTILNGRIVYEA